MKIELTVLSRQYLTNSPSLVNRRESGSGIKKRISIYRGINAQVIRDLLQTVMVFGQGISSEDMSHVMARLGTRYSNSSVHSPMNVLAGKPKG